MAKMRDSNLTTSEEEGDETIQQHDQQVDPLRRRNERRDAAKPELQRPKTKHMKTPSWDSELPIPSLSFGVASRVIFFCAVTCYFHTYDVGYIHDDIPAILNNKDVNPRSPISGVFSNDYYGNPMGGENKQRSYRPMTVLTFRLEQLISLAEHVKPVFSHVINIVLYGVTCVVMLKLFSSIFGGSSWSNFHSPKASFLAALIYTVHPLHTENVSSLVGRADVICSVFAALAFIFYMEACKKAYESKLNLLGCVVCAFLSILCKEQGIAILVVCSVYDMTMSDTTGVAAISKHILHKIFNNESRAANTKTTIPRKLQLVIDRSKCILCIFLVIVFIRWGLLSDSKLEIVAVDNWRAFGINIFYKIINYNYLYSIKAFQVLIPNWLCCDWSMGCIPLITSPADYRMWVVTSFCTCGLLVLVSCRAKLSAVYKRLVCICVAWTTLTLLPPGCGDGHAVSDSALLLPSAGACMLLTVALSKLCQLPVARKVAALLILVLVTKFAVRTRQRASEWRDAENLYSADLAVCPLNPRLHFLLGQLYLEAGRLTSSEDKFNQALRLEPDYPDAVFALGRMLMKQNRLKHANQWIKKAIHLDSNNADYWSDLGRVQLDQGDENAAIKSFQRTVELRPQDGVANLQLARFYTKQKKLRKAIEFYANVAKFDSQNKEAWTQIVGGFFKLGLYRESAQVGTTATRSFPDDAHMHHVTAVALHKIGKHLDSEKHHLVAIKLKPKEQKYYLEMAAMYEGWKRYDKAKDAYVKGLKLNYTNSDVWGKLFRLHVKENKMGINLVNSEVKPATSGGGQTNTAQIPKPSRNHAQPVRQSNVPKS